MRSWLKYCSLAVLLAIAGASLVESSVDAAAQTSGFYQQTVVIRTECGLCTFKFNTVPAGKTLHLNYVTCWLAMSSTGGIEAASIANGTNVLYYLAGLSQGNAQSITINSPISMEVYAGKTPIVRVYGNENVATTSGCTLIGDLL
jgi:hypothetical protein